MFFLRDLYKKRFDKNKRPEDWQKFKEFRNAVNKERRANILQHTICGATVQSMQ